MEEFLALSEIMVTYSGFGDENYELFSQACYELKQAYGRKDFPAFLAAFDYVKQIRHDCHFQFRR